MYSYYLIKKNHGLGKELARLMSIYIIMKNLNLLSYWSNNYSHFFEKD